MKKLTEDKFSCARDFMKSQGRRLDQAIFNLEFERGSVENVLTQLETYQNPDGGFGHALEPDVRTPTSSALCTEIGLRMLSEFHIPADHPMVGAAVEFLFDTFNPETNVWCVIPEDANDYPHAPWWHDSDGSLANTFDDFLIIPRAGILATLYHYVELVPPQWLDHVTQATIADLKILDSEEFGGGGDGLVYTRRLAEAPGLPMDVKAWLVPRVKEIADQIVARDPAQWTEYCAPPLKLAPTPASITADVLNDCIPNHLDYLIKTQMSEGFWEPNWSWGDFYPEEWLKAKQEWRSDLTIMNLLTLKAFGRLF